MRTLLSGFFLFIVAGCGQAANVAQQSDAQVEDSLRMIVADVFAGISARDVERALRPMSEDIVYIGDGVLINGRDSLVSMARAAFEDWKSVDATVKIGQVQRLAPDVAVVTWESRMNAKIGNGTDVPYGGVTTAVFHHRDGRWQIVRQHQCAPMPPEHGALTSHTKAIEGG